MAKLNLIKISGAVVFRDNRGRRQWLVVKQKEEGDWEIPKVTVRRGESSVRASIRMTSELAGMNARVLEEAGRGTGSALVNGKTTPQKYYYYLMSLISAGEVLGFEDFNWLEYVRAKAKLSSKREQTILSQAKEVLHEWEKQRKGQKEVEI